MIELVEEPLDINKTIEKVRGDAYGAIVTFIGTVRRDSKEGKTLFLEYEADRDMAVRKLQEILAEVKARWSLDDVAISHRLGKLKVGENCVVIAVAAPHRRDAFEACQHIIEGLKKTVPIWKKETTSAKSHWVGAES